MGEASAISVRDLFDPTTNGPRAELIRGKCPECGDHLVSNCYYVWTRGYVITWECWSSLAEKPTCSYRKLI